MSNHVDDKTHDELCLLYSVSAGDLAFFKRQQWMVTNYVLALDAALVTLAIRLGANFSALERLALAGLILVAAIGGAATLSNLQRSIAARRERLATIRAGFSNQFLGAWAALEKPMDFVFGLLFAVIVLALALSWWIIGFHT